MLKNLPSDPQHPLWHTIRCVLGVTCVTIVLWANASDFDVTEGRSIAAIGALLGIGLGAEKTLFGMLKRQEKP